MVANLICFEANRGEHFFQVSVSLQINYLELHIGRCNTEWTTEDVESCIRFIKYLKAPLKLLKETKIFSQVLSISSIAKDLLDVEDEQDCCLMTLRLCNNLFRLCKWSVISTANASSYTHSADCNCPTGFIFMKFMTFNTRHCHLTSVWYGEPWLTPSSLRLLSN